MFKVIIPFLTTLSIPLAFRGQSTMGGEGHIPIPPTPFIKYGENPGQKSPIKVHLAPNAKGIS
jgi:hypothetical protein